MYMATAGQYEIDCVEIVPRHAEAARRNIQRAGLQTRISVRDGDYHNLEAFAAGGFDGLYTMETLVHATDPRHVLREFWRLLKPGGHIVLHEYDHMSRTEAPKVWVDTMDKVNRYAAMPANASFTTDGLRTLMKEVGFEDIRQTDFSPNIVPMLRLFYVFAIIPYYIFRLLGIEHRFINTVAGAQGYRDRDGWRYIQTVGKKAG